MKVWHIPVDNGGFDKQSHDFFQLPYFLLQSWKAKQNSAMLVSTKTC